MRATRNVCRLLMQLSRWAVLLGALAGGCADEPDVAPARVSLGFVPVETRTASQQGQTLAHMELTGIQFLPAEQGLIVWEKNGRVVHYAQDGEALTFLGEFRIDDVEQESDCGLISIALDPDWEQNHLLFAGHCVSATHSAVTRYRFDPSAADYAAVGETGRRIITFGDASANRAWHNVGALGFFQDAERSMWILVGDKRHAANAQDSSNNLGGILRIIPSRGDGGGYEPHPDNPFGGPGSDPALQSSPDLYAWGLRSPWRGASDARGRIWIGEVGERFEEINLSTRAGQNFGWGDADGPCEGDGDACESLTDPVAWWGRSSGHRYVREDREARGTTKRVAWVGSPYRSSDGDDPYAGLLDDAILIADMCVGFVRALSVDDQGKVVRDEALGHMLGLSGAAQAPDGRLYVTSYGDCTSDSYGVGSGIYRAVLQEQVAPQRERQRDALEPLVDDPLGPMPLKLSETGIFADMAQQRPSAKAIVYEPTFPLWTNGSSKQRLLFLPDGARVDNSAREHWEYPTGALFVKSFSYPDADDPAPVETRIIRRMQDGWDFQVYRWRDGEGYLLALEQPIPARIRWKGQGQDERKLTHEIPSRFDCKSCHEHNETVIIGFDELRLNGPAGSTQLQQLAQREVFSQAPPADPAQVRDADARTREVLGYLHGNCAHCHNSSANSESKLDLTYNHALEQTVGMETQGSGQAAGVRVEPGAPERSLLFLALRGDSDDPELKPMPPLGVQLRDARAIELVRAWITALQP